MPMSFMDGPLHRYTSVMPEGEKLGGASGVSAPLVGIGLTEPPNMGEGGQCPPPPGSGITVT